MNPEPTGAACLTPPGTGAIAVLGVCGPRAWEAVQPLFSARQPVHLEAGRFRLGRFGADLADEVVLVVKRVEPTPWLELHCHGGTEVVRMCLEALARRGLAIWSWQQWLQMTETPLRAAAETALAHTHTARTASIVLDQVHGALDRAVRAILAAYDEGNTDAAGHGLAELVRHIPVGRHLTRPWRVVIAGAPNVGKSSLANALAGYRRSVVSPVPGTTRDVVASWIAVDGWPVELADTAGLRAGAEQLEEAGIGLARDAMAGADLCLWVLDGSGPPVWPDKELPRLRYAINKADLPRAWDRNDAVGAVEVSALTGTGMPELVESLSRWLVPAPPQSGAAVPFTLELCDRIEEAARLHALNRVGEVIHVLGAFVVDPAG